MKKITALLLTVLMFASFVSCAKTGETQTASGESEPTVITVTDLVGREIEVKPGSYKRVVCIGAGALRMYSYIGDIALLCGVEDIDNLSLEARPKMFDSAARPYVMAYGETFKTLPSCGVGGPNAQTAEGEKILSCSPDIVISEYEDADKENALQKQLGVPVITLRSGVDGVFGEALQQSLTLLGQVFGKEQRAKELIDFVVKERDEISRRTADIPEDEKPSVYICGLGNWGTTDHLMTIESYTTFEAAHIKNAVSGLAAKGIQKIEKEKFAALGEDIDYMFIDAAAIKNIKPQYAEDPEIFDTCKAWQTGNVCLEMAYNAYYTNYEIALANAWFIAKTVYPDKFEDIDITAKTNEITSAFLGREMAEEIFSAAASFGGYRKIDKDFFA